MKEIEFNEIKTIDLGIIKDIDRVCRKNNINYTIIGGTLIGAVRHNGFIPWDDDIDIAIERKDYDRFVDIYNKEKSKNYTIFNKRINKEYYYQFTKVCDNRTSVDENTMIPIEGLGIFVDVFPLDKISSKNLNFKLKKINFYAKAYFCKITKKEAFETPKLKKVLKKILYFRSAQYYYEKIQKLSQKENSNEKSDLEGVLVCGTGIKDLFPISIFNKYCDLKFEKLNLMAVSDYEVFLKHRFGDYMKLPPKEEQITHHTMKSYWK